MQTAEAQIHDKIEVQPQLHGIPGASVVEIQRNSERTVQYKCEKRHAKTGLDANQEGK